LRVGSVSSFLDAPLQHALAEGSYSKLDVNLNWVKCPQDAGAVMSMLSAGLIDMGFMFTEDAVAFALQGSIRICGTFLSTPRRWGLHVSCSNRDCVPSFLANGLLGIPDENGGAIMASVISDQPGFEALMGVQRKTLSSVRRACEAMSRNLIQGAIWERRTASGLVDCGEWDVLLDLPMPWPALVIVATRDSLYAKAGAIKHFIDFARVACQDFKANQDGKSSEFLKLRYGMVRDEAAAWLSSMSWPCECEVAESTILGPLARLEALGLVPAGRVGDPARLIAKDLCLMAQLGTRVPSPRKCHDPVAADGGGAEDEDFCLPAEPTAPLEVASASQPAEEPIQASPAGGVWTDEASESPAAPPPDREGSSSACEEHEPVPAG